ncbi:MAG: hypothetical protein OEV62_12410 [Actinomycetota bacterium]|nr:hypothetical protein [Actinomycetota bacterium]
MGPTRVTRLTGVYHADGGLRGELAYVVGKLRGTAHCGLCDITHSPLRRKKEWQAYVGGLPVPFDTVHLNDRSAEVRAVTEGQTPCVVAHTDTGVSILVPASELDSAGGDVEAFSRTLASALDAHGLTLG